MCGNPRPDCDIRDGNAVAHDVAGSVLTQLAIQGTVETMGLIDVTVNRILEFLGGIA